MRNGWICLQKGIVNHWIFEDAERFRAWVDMLMLANWKENQWVFKGKPFSLKRGSFITSQCKLAARWKWSRASVQRFLILLESAAMIEQQTSTSETMITIVNYNKYQDELKEDEQQTSNKRATNEQQTSTNEQYNNKQYIYPHTETTSISLDPPKHLSKTTEPLLSWPANEEPGAVWMTQRQWDGLIAKVGRKAAGCLCLDLESYAENKPAAYRKYKSHYQTLLNWHRNAISDGKAFFDHPTEGPGYFKTWVIENFQKQNGARNV